MDWGEHHRKNAKRSFWAGIAVFIAGTAVGSFDWYFGWTEDPGQLILLVIEFWLPATALLAVSASQKSKAKKKLITATPGGPDVQEAFFFSNREIMIKQLTGLQPSYRYFSVDGEGLMELKEISQPLWLLADFIRLRPFLRRTFALLDRNGETQLLLKQTAGLNAPVDVFLPDGERIASYKQGMVKVQIEVKNGDGNAVGIVKGDSMGTIFSVVDHQGATLMKFYNGGLPSRNYDYFSSSDDLVKIVGDITSDERLYKQIVALPAFIKIFYSRRAG